MKQDKKKINIGFDIGTTSVGWSILDNDWNIIDMGVRLFDDPANAKDGKLENEKRRSSRTQRRRIRRIRTRKDIFTNFLIDAPFINQINKQATKFVDKHSKKPVLAENVQVTEKKQDKEVK